MDTWPLTVIGDGWAAIASVAQGLSQNIAVCWIPGTASHLLPPLFGLEISNGQKNGTTKGLEACQHIARTAGIELGEPQVGIFLKEFRNKSFRLPLWLKGGMPSGTDPDLWLPEKRFAPPQQAKFSISMAELDHALRKALTTQRFPLLTKKEAVPVTSFQLPEHEGETAHVLLGSGEKISTQKILYAGNWSALSNLDGLPKPMPLLYKRNPSGILQAQFIHRKPVGTGLSDTYFAALPREAGENVERHIWGYFTSDGMRSIWTLCLSPEEGEDNHIIAKKFRKLKSTLDRVFTALGDATGEASSETPPQPLPQLSKDQFTSIIADEQVRFQEEAIFTDSGSEGQPLSEPLKWPEAKGIEFLTDAYGASYAFAQACK